MTNLTEKWKKGELESGYYYVIVKEEFSNRIDFYNSSATIWSYHSNDVINQILAPVPSYAEYMCLVDYKEELTKACKMRDKIIKKYEDIDTWWQAENQKLKELLKICKCEFEEITTFCNNEIEYAYKHTNNFCIPTESLAIILGSTDNKELLTKIDEVLK